MWNIFAPDDREWEAMEFFVNPMELVEQGF